MSKVRKSTRTFKPGQFFPGETATQFAETYVGPLRGNEKARQRAIQRMKHLVEEKKFVAWTQHDESGEPVLGFMFKPHLMRQPRPDTRPTAGPRRLHRRFAPAVLAA